MLAEGLTDAAGFVAGGLLGFALGRVLGWDIFATGGAAIAGIVLCGLGGGAGVHLARRWRARRQGAK
ncbi:hypothetical protein [Ramlibacter pallidus]|uniref:GlsB/YeaQ/YmgE family stress response membrane protein n=1 Tax=Ramlibacter pallidus TaxID=2780087 RepID=A0ABR9RZH0_9BURK|nr:hypothetical protein [Ramlibacter pallidus]MBE7366654.1 hypothetical protein [Ramlibacter pallidus]